MEWNKVVLDWVNCLRLTENNLTSVSEIGDGKFFCEILQLLFRKTVNVKNKGQIYTILKDALQGFYTPSDWIDFGGAFAGTDEELVKIVLVIIGVGSLQSEEKLFIENPSEYLAFETQIKLRKFLVSVLENGKVVDSRFASESDLNEKEHALPLRLEEKQVNPGIFTVADGNNIPDNNEISTLKNRIEVLTACQQDLMDDIGSYKNENLKLTQRCEELEKENQTWKLQFDLNNTFEPESPKNDKTPERARNAANSLKESLKRSENYVGVLENRIDEANSKLQKLEEEMTSLKQTLIMSSTREAELLKELEKEEREKEDLYSIIQDKDEILKKLKQEIDDYKDCQLMNNSGSPMYSTMHASGIMGLSVCESFNNSPNSTCLGVSHCEEMASDVIEVQLRESQELLQASENAVAETRKQLDAQLEESKAVMDTFQTQIVQARKEVKESYAEKQKLEEEMTSLKQTLIMSSTREAELLKELEKEEREKEAIEVQFRESQELLQASEYAVAETRKQLDARIADLEAAKTSISKNQKELEILFSTISLKDAQLQESKAVMDTFQTQIVQARKEEFSLAGQMKWLAFLAFVLFFIAFTPELLPTLVEIVVGRQSMSCIAEKHGRLVHLSIPII